ncbi:uroporphyrinogen decarboxylase family protein [Geomonas subterranea]|uniref:Uroporphyrinogen decarboxylase family protein n=1 Tax=Geomonas subterranea TaxID=2847989 RepID=A0ABX8LIM6_9BACT|nr:MULTISPECIES: uroporphyrinogen decarboxylase family protein [Geomonas]QXE90098.1 uroporphyrinogen decarboxylase family protein [Geomonas subterranea]QXM07778.1 uroporphyrinogen decarboxylase family protein [Geomonas subterranea]
MTSMERVLTTLSHREPDRVPLFLLLSLHGARELGLTIEKYFSRAEHVVQGQLRMLERYGHDCIYTFFHASLEAEAWGGCTIFREDGPPNAGPPPVTADAIASLTPPRVEDVPCLRRVLEAQRALRQAVGEAVPVIGVVMSPFSLPVMQLGFDHYLDLMFDRPDLMQRLMELNGAFCADWANAQLAAGAHAICYFDPLASPKLIDPLLYRRYGAPAAQKAMAAISGPTATHLASGPCLPVVDDLAASGTMMVGVGGEEELAAVKNACRGRLTVLGNLNGVEMRSWDEGATLAAVKGAIDAAAPGGGFILSDQHGEIPWQVPEATLRLIGEAAREFGSYTGTGGRD